MSQEYGHGLAGSSGSESLTGSKAKCWLKLQSPQGLIASKFIHMVVGRIQFFIGCWIEVLISFMAIYQRQPSASCQVVLFTGQLTTWQLDSSKWAIRARERECKQDESHSLYNIIIEVTLHHFCHILFLRSQSLGPVYIQGKEISLALSLHVFEWEFWKSNLKKRQRNHTRAWIPGSEDYWKPF